MVYPPFPERDTGNSFADTTADEVHSKSTTITNNPSLLDMNLTFKNGRLTFSVQRSQLAVGNYGQRI